MSGIKVGQPFPAAHSRNNRALGFVYFVHDAWCRSKHCGVMVMVVVLVLVVVVVPGARHMGSRLACVMPPCVTLCVVEHSPSDDYHHPRSTPMTTTPTPACVRVPYLK